jgi:hypothetical protein
MLKVPASFSSRCSGGGKVKGTAEGVDEVVDDAKGDGEPFKPKMEAMLKETASPSR